MCAAVYVLSTVMGYVLTSALLLKCPTLLHRRKREPFLSRHISHRGGECCWNLASSIHNTSMKLELPKGSVVPQDISLTWLTPTSFRAPLIYELLSVMSVFAGAGENLENTMAAFKQ